MGCTRSVWAKSGIWNYSCRYRTNYSSHKVGVRLNCLNTGKSQEIVVKIVPLDASVFVSVAVCHVGSGVHAIIPDPLITTKLSAIGKNWSFSTHLIQQWSNIFFALKESMDTLFSRKIQYLSKRFWAARHQIRRKWFSETTASCPLSLLLFALIRTEMKCKIQLHVFFTCITNVKFLIIGLTFDPNLVWFRLCRRFLSMLSTIHLRWDVIRWIDTISVLLEIAMHFWPAGKYKVIVFANFKNYCVILKGVCLCLPKWLFTSSQSLRSKSNPLPRMRPQAHKIYSPLRTATIYWILSAMKGMYSLMLIPSFYQVNWYWVQITDILFELPRRRGWKSRDKSSIFP